MSYNPENQYRCTIIRGKSQTDMEDLLPLYANLVHNICPCTEDEFKNYGCKILSQKLFQISSFDKLSGSNKKTVLNHLTEIAGTLLGLYYPSYDAQSGKLYINESESCIYLNRNSDFPVFFKNICLNFQFPNGAKNISHVKDDLRNQLRIKPFCYIVALLFFAQKQKSRLLLSKQEIGYYVLNNLDVLQGKIPPQRVYDRIMQDRRNNVKREKLSGSRDWQHIKEMFNLLELANIIESDSTYIWLNPSEKENIKLFIDRLEDVRFDAYSYSLQNPDETRQYFSEWKKYYGTFNKELISIKTTFISGGEDEDSILDRDKQNAKGTAIKSTIDLGDDGEALVFRLEQERIRNFKERLVNKVLLLGKTKGLGYDISSIEADEDTVNPEFARYIEVKTTRRITKPSFDEKWSDSLNLTSKEWIAAQQYRDYYNIYRVYFTKKETCIIRIKNPFDKSERHMVEVFPTIFQMNFNKNAIDKKYEVE